MYNNIYKKDNKDKWTFCEILITLCAIVQKRF